MAQAGWAPREGDVTPLHPDLAVLAVSSAPGTLEAVVLALEQDGFRVDVSSDGPAALAAYRPQHAVVLIDDAIKMAPVELCRALRARSQVPIIVLTASGDEDSVVAVLEAGADHVVTVPATARELVARARAAMRRGPVPVQEEPAIEIGAVRLDPADTW